MTVYLSTRPLGFQPHYSGKICLVLFIADSVCLYLVPCCSQAVRHSLVTATLFKFVIWAALRWGNLPLVVNNQSQEVHHYFCSTGRVLRQSHHCINVISVLSAIHYGQKQMPRLHIQIGHVIVPFFPFLLAHVGCSCLPMSNYIRSTEP